MIGKVWLVGAGPGDRGLFTLKGLEVLQKADVVVYDALVGDAVLSMIPDTARTVYVGKRAGLHARTQEQINQILLEEALQGNRVVRLQGGDPFLFGRGGEELALLVEHSVPYEVVPGITSALAVPAYNGIPVTHRDYTSSVHLITGHRRQGLDIREDRDINFDALVRTRGTLVFLMGLSSIGSITRGLLDAGMDPDMPAAVLEKGTTAAQRRITGTVRTIEAEAARAKAQPPAIIVVGEVCTLAETLSWAEKRPLAGKKILVTRPKELVSELSARLRQLGAEVLELPAIETVPIEPAPLLEDSLREAFGPEKRQPADWLVFTSPTGVRVFMDRFLQEYDIRALGPVRIAAIGEGSARALRGFGLRPDLVPTVYDGQTLGRELAETIVRERQALAETIAQERQTLRETIVQERQTLSETSAQEKQTVAVRPAAGSAMGTDSAEDPSGKEYPVPGSGAEAPVRILIPRAAAGNRELIEELERAGNVVIRDIPTYHTQYTKPQIIDERAKLESGEISCVVFTSSSTVRGFSAVMEGLDLSGIQAVCIGRQTRETADACGMRTAMAERATMDALVDAVVALYGNEN